MSRGRTPSRNLRLHGYEECADFVARTIRINRKAHEVHVSETGSLHLTRLDSARARVNELPASWSVGSYPYTGMRVEFIEDDLLARLREITEARAEA